MHRSIRRQRLRRLLLFGDRDARSLMVERKQPRKRIIVVDVLRPAVSRSNSGVQLLVSIVEAMTFPCVPARG